VGWGFLKGLEQSVERVAGEHVDFVDDVDLESARAGRVLRVLAQLADVIDAVVGCPVNFDDVHAP
jgi:hypothetical protein